MLAAGCVSLSTPFRSPGTCTGERRLFFSEDASRRAVEIASTDDCFDSGVGDELGGDCEGVTLRLEGLGGGRLAVLRGNSGCEGRLRACLA